MASFLVASARKAICQNVAQNVRRTPAVAQELRRPLAFFSSTPTTAENSGSDPPEPELGGIPIDDPEGRITKTFDGPIDLDKPTFPEPPSEKVQRLAEELINLSLVETADLGKILKERLNLPDTGMMVGGFAASGVAADEGEGGGAEEAPAEAKTEFDVKLESFDAGAKIKVIKEIRAVTELGLKEAKALVESAPIVIKKDVSKETGESIIEKLKGVGAVVVLE